MPAPVRASSVERALIGQTLNVENIMAASNQVVNDLGSNIIGDIYASAEYRRAMAAVEIRHALFHITGEAHVGSRALSVLHGVQYVPVDREAIPDSDPGSIADPVPSTESVNTENQPRKRWWEFWRRS